MSQRLPPRRDHTKFQPRYPIPSKVLRPTPLWRRPVRLAQWAADRISISVWRALHWLWKERLWAMGRLWATLWRVIAFVGLSYLVYDRIYEVNASISPSASDPSFPFTFPFSIQNNSHMFAIKNVAWKCNVITLKSASTNGPMSNVQLTFGGSASVIAAGQNLNFECAPIGPSSRFISSGKIQIDEAVISIALTYRADFFGLFSLTRQPPATRFTWVSDASNPQWIKGDFAH